LLSQLKPFEGKEFADLLHKCHNIIRNNEHLDPAAAFDEIAKILFIKVWVERRLKERSSLWGQSNILGQVYGVSQTFLTKRFHFFTNLASILARISIRSLLNC